MDVSALRSDTPGCASVLHFNNAGSSLPPRPVLNAQIEYLTREAQIGGYEAEAEASDQLAHTYSAIAEMLGCDADEVALLESATAAWDAAFYAMDFAPSDRILTSAASYASNYIAFLQVARRTGASVEPVPSTDAGEIDVDRLRAMMDDDVRLIALTHIPTNGGLVNPAEAVGEIAAEGDVPFLLDACQSAGQMPLDVEALGCTMLSATGRKFLRGPRGTGFLYVRRDWIDRLEPPMLDLHAATWTRPDTYEIRDDARRFESYESHLAGRVGLGVAVDYALDLGLDAIFERVQTLAATLRTRLSALDGVTVHDIGRTQCGITTFSAQSKPAADIRTALRACNVNTSLSTPSSTRLDAEARQLPDMVRASVHYYNTEAEIDRFIDRLSHVLSS